MSGSGFDEAPRVEPRSRAEWRRWLARHHAESSGVWLVYPKKSSGLRGPTYDEAVEEALCFGWIDSRVRPLDELRRDVELYVGCVAGASLRDDYLRMIAEAGFEEGEVLGLVVGEGRAVESLAGIGDAVGGEDFRQTRAGAVHRIELSEVELVGPPLSQKLVDVAALAVRAVCVGALRVRPGPVLEQPFVLADHHSVVRRADKAAVHGTLHLDGARDAVLLHQ